MIYHNNHVCIIGYIITTLKAADRDDNQNGQTTFGWADSLPQHFKLNPYTGKQQLHSNPHLRSITN